MTVPTPKYKIGDKVFAATLTSATIEYPCPDCQGTKLWKITTPAGFEFDLDCQRCNDSGAMLRGPNQRIPSLKHSKFVPCVKILTIGSVRINTDDANPVTYMAHETGVGSGRVWNECDLFHDQQSALEAATQHADAQNAENAEKPAAMRTAHYASLSLYSAALGLSWTSIYDAWNQSRDQREVIDELLNNDDFRNKLGQDWIDRLEEAITKNPWRNPHPLEALIEACVSGDMDKINKALADLPRPLPVKTEAAA